MPHVIPEIKKNGKGMIGKDACAWADVATVIPWTVYVMGGDKALLEENRLELPLRFQGA